MLPIRLFYINLASRNDRREIMEDTLRTHFRTIPYERMEAVRPDPDLLLQYNKEGRLREEDYLRVLSNETSFLTTGSVGCFASHIALWKKAVEMGIILVVLEDDVILSEDVEDRLYEGLASLDENELRIAYMGQPLRQWEEGASPYNDYFWRITNGYYGTFGYVIHPSHAAFLLNRLEAIPMTEHVDNAMLRVQASEQIPVLLFRKMLLSTPTDPGRDSDVMCSRRRRRQRIDLIKIPKLFHFICHPDVERQRDYWQALHPDYQCLMVEEDKIPMTGGFLVAPHIFCRRNLNCFLQSTAVDFNYIRIDESPRLFYGSMGQQEDKILSLPQWILGNNQHSLFFVEKKK